VGFVWGRHYQASTVPSAWSQPTEPLSEPARQLRAVGHRPGELFHFLFQTVKERRSAKHPDFNISKILEFEYVSPVVCRCWAVVFVKKEGIDWRA
jgi:hypothetical protein